MASSFLTLFTLALALAVRGATPFNPPAVPLVVRSPFNHVWLNSGNGTALNARWPTIWNTKVNPWTAYARVDGKTYRAMGSPQRGYAADQVDLKFTATSSTFTMRAGPIDLYYNFLSPVDPTDLVRFSLPFSYVIITASSNDGKPHDVQLYMDISTEWVNEERTTAVQWKTRRTDASEAGDDALITHQAWLASPLNFTQTQNNRIQDGSVFISAFNRPGLTSATGAAPDMRAVFIDTGVLPDTYDSTFRTVADRWPALAFSHQLGQVLGMTAPTVIAVGHARENIALYARGENQSQIRAAYYLKQYASAEAACDSFMWDWQHMFDVSKSLDEQISRDAGAESENYAGLVQLSFRQAIAGMELTVARKADGSIDGDDVMMFTAEMGGQKHRVSEVDQMHWMTPMLLYLNPDLVKYMLRPTLQFHKAGLAPSRSAVHHIGDRYPQALGSTNLYEMPVVASAYMINMVLAHFQRTNDRALIDDYSDVLLGFADYLVDAALNPALQFVMPDGRIIDRAAKQTNVAVAGIIAIRAFADLVAARGDATASAKYKEIAESYIQQWRQSAVSADGAHLRFVYDDDVNYTITYNLYDDRLLKLALVPPDIFIMQESWYERTRTKYGPAIMNSRGYGLTEATIWAAATVERPSLREHLYEGIVTPLASGMMNKPMPDWFDSEALTPNDRFRARPHVGAHFARLALQGKRYVPSASGPQVDAENPPDEKDAGVHLVPSLRPSAVTSLFICLYLFLGSLL